LYFGDLEHCLAVGILRIRTLVLRRANGCRCRM
jgi:hypothetical protein